MNIKYLYILAIFTITFSNINAQNREYTSDTLTMEAGYSNDLFYSMADGLVASVTRSGWDIAFYTSAFSAGIITNEGSGVELYTYPNGDTSNWSNMDTIGLSTWKHMINSSEVWEDGAFNCNALGHPDYGWGVYNSVTHGVIGDSLYVINLPGVGLKKLWIVEKVSVDNIYHLKYANLDGTDEQIVEIDVKPYMTKNFAYYSLETSEISDREPSENWDLLFTKYFDVTYDNEGNPVDYLVTGVTSNINRFTKKYYPVADDYDDWSAAPFDSLKNTIGFNWKSFSMATFQWEIEDSTAFFVMNEIGDVYKLVFTLWEGAGTGVFALNKQLVSANFISDEMEKVSSLELYPNPATDRINIRISTDISFEGKLIITDISGRMVYNEVVYSNNNTPIIIETSNFTEGLYFVTLVGPNFRESAKFIVR